MKQKVMVVGLHVQGETWVGFHRWNRTESSYKIRYYRPRNESMQRLLSVTNSLKVHGEGTVIPSCNGWVYCR